VLLAIAGTSSNTGAPLAQVIEKHFRDDPIDPGEITQVLADYSAKKRGLGAMDFDDLLLNGLKLLTENKEILARYQDQFVHVLVDEYQDTNRVQAEIVDRIASGHGNLFVVGDDFQSIYGWRGASIANILTFAKRYPAARTFALETNYRSVPEILEVANACIAHNPEQFQKRLRSTREPSDSPTLVTLLDAEQQARYVVEQIRGLMREGFKLDDIAVLYRAHYHAMELQMLLTREGLPYAITSGTRFFEQAHIKDVCSIVRICSNSRDELAFSRLLCLLPKVGQKTAQKAWRKLGGEFRVEDAGSRDILLKGLPAAARGVWKDIDAVLAAYGEEELSTDVGELMRRFLASYYAHYGTATFENYEHREDDINELIGYAGQFKNAEMFLSDLALFSNVDGEVKADDTAEAGTLRLSTVHQAKGLEWAAVLVLWLTDGMFPSARSLAESKDGEAEERRLFYVAITRAKDVLHLCSPGTRRKSDGSLMPCITSRFLTELSPDLFREVWD
jgi:DNA helicase-2/ATP-dependent DNA helicase PcrA